MAQLSTRPQDPQPDTWIQAPPFEVSDDRRSSARVPTALKVRLGPAREPPTTTLLCEDVSEGGLFVRCGQPVQLGARFSVELTLSNGDALYVPEAEVLYNVEGEGTRRGFGARFVALTREARERLLDLARFGSDIQPRRDVSRSMILATRDYTTSRMRRVPDLVVPRVSDLRVATLRPAAVPEDGELHGATEPPHEMTVEARGREVSIEAREVSDTLVPAKGFAALGVGSDVRAIPTPPLAEDEDEPSMLDGATLPPLSGELDDDHAERRAPRRSGPAWWVGVAGVAAVVLLGAWVGVRGAPAGAATPERVTGRVSGPIAEALTSSRENAPIVAPLAAKAPAAAPGGALSKLDAESRGAEAKVASGAAKPRAVVAAKPEAKAVAKAVAPAKAVVAAPAQPEAKAVVAQPEAKAVVAQPEAKAVAPAKAEAKAVVPVAKAATKTEPSDQGPDAAAPTPAIDLDAVVARLTPGAAAKAAAPAAATTRAPASPSKAVLTVAPGTRVMRTHVLREPARFVVDLESSAAPSVATGAARVGRHDGFVRVVVDSEVALTGGTAVITGDRLAITLERR